MCSYCPIVCDLLSLVVQGQMGEKGSPGTEGEEGPVVSYLRPFSTF